MIYPKLLQSESPQLYDFPEHIHNSYHPHYNQKGPQMQAFSVIKKDQRCVFMRRYWHAQSAAEIAKDCGMSVSAVNTLLHRTRKQLEEHLLSHHIYL